MTSDAIDTGTDAMNGDELQRIVTRLREVQRRFAAESGDGERFEHAEQRLAAVVGDLEAHLNGERGEDGLDGIELRLAAVEEMVEGLGFPGYAHVIESVRNTLGATSGARAPVDREEPPPPRRFEPSPRALRRRPAPSATAAPREPSGWSGGRKLAMALVVGLVVLAGGLAAAFALGLVTLDRWFPGHGTGAEQADDPGPARVPVWSAPADPDDGEPPPESEAFRETARSLGEILVEIDEAEAALESDDLDSALRHLAEAAAIDRHHRGVVGLAESLIDALLVRADEAFDDARWELAAKRVEDARHLADGLYLDTSAIEHTARRHAAMTRFRDIAPVTLESARAAVGRAVRLTLRSRDELFGTLEAVEGDRLVLSIHSGVHGGGVEFDKRVDLGDAVELRVYEATRVADVIL